MFNSQVPDPWRGFLSEIDQFLTEPVKLICIGGFVITLQYGLSRPTADIDVVELAPSSMLTPILEISQQGSLLHRKYGVYIQSVTGITSLPYEFESRIGEMFAGQFKHLRIFALDPYDLVLSKLTRNNDKDFQDFMAMATAIPLEGEVLRLRYYDELRPYLIGRPESTDIDFQEWMEWLQNKKADTSAIPDRQKN